MKSEQLNPEISLAKRLWNIDWKLPWTVGDVTIREGSFADALPFILEHYGAIFGATEGSRFFVEPMNYAKRRFGAEMDIFIFEHQNRVVGISMGNAQDWSTYYIRSTAFLPDYRSRDLGGAWLSRALDVLRAAGVVRAEADCSPMNAPCVRVLMSHGFVVTSTAPSERWGVNLHLTCFLERAAEEKFAERFCQLAVPYRTSRSSVERKGGTS